MNTLPTPGDVSSPLGRPGLRALIDDVVIVFAIFGSMVIALVLAWRLVAHDERYPPTLITLFLGITISALIYRFLGGSQGNEFKIVGIKLVGSAALLGVIMVLAGDRLRDELRMFETRAEYEEVARGRETLLQRTTETMTARTRERDEALAESTLLRRNAELSGRSVLDAVRQLAPDDPIAGELRALARAERGPFRTLIRELRARAVVNGSVATRSTYNICSDTFETLYPSSPNTDISVRRVTADGSSYEVQLTRKQEIDREFCAEADRPLDIQLSCEDGLELFPDFILACDGRRPRFSREFGVQRVTLGAMAR